jgi:hypothetical protein
MWRNEAYKLGGNPLPWDADELIEKAVKAEREEFAKHAVDIARRAVAEEREACAKVADAWVQAYEHPSKVIAETIRKRGQA